MAREVPFLDVPSEPTVTSVRPARVSAPAESPVADTSAKVWGEHYPRVNPAFFDPRLFPPLSTFRVPGFLRSGARLLGGDLPERVVHRQGVRIRVFGPPPEITIGRATIADVTIRTGRPGMKFSIGAYGGIVRVTVLLGTDTHRDITGARLKKNMRGYPEGGGGPDIHVGHDVWLGEGALLMGKADVADGAIVGARSVVTGPVPPYAIVAGVPAKVIGQRFSPTEALMLLEARWWELPPQVIDQNLELFYSRDVAAVRDLALRHRAKR